jgi:hypothetical protein
MVPYRGHLVGTAVMSYISVAVLVSAQVVVSGNTECLNVVWTRPVAVVVCSKTKRKFEQGYLLPSSMFGHAAVSAPQLLLLQPTHPDASRC